jgi:hypothetical protein
MERRVIIFTDHDANELGKKEHDDSIISSLPRVGDDILDMTKLSFQEYEHSVHAKVRVVEFDYPNETVFIFAEVLK